jgi:hypothetical protein
MSVSSTLSLTSIGDELFKVCFLLVGLVHRNLEDGFLHDNKQLPAPGSGVLRQNTVSDNKQMPAPGSGVLRQNTVSQCCKPNTKYSACHKPFA